MRGKTIRQFLIDGAPEGRCFIELSNWTGKAYRIPRTYVQKCADRQELMGAGVYFLFGIDDDTEERQVYIGESEHVLLRIQQHIATQDFWTECVLFISKDETLNKARIKYLENHLYWLAKKSKRYKVLNITVPTESSLSEMDRAEMDEFMDHMQLLLGVLGYKVLEPIERNMTENQDIIFYLKDTSGAHASGRMDPEGFLIFKDSVISQKTVASMPKAAMRNREELREKDIIDAQGKFVQDWIFSSPSLEASVIVGYSINGRTAWKDQKGDSVKDIEEKANGQSAAEQACDLVPAEEDTE